MIQDGGKMVYGKGTGIYCSKKNHSVKRRCEMVVNMESNGLNYTITKQD